MHRLGIAPGVAIAVALALVLAGTAEAKRKTFRPAAKGVAAFVFKPRGIEAGDVRRATLLVSHEGRRRKHRIAVPRVRRSLRAATRLRLHRPRGARRARLRVAIRASVDLSNCSFPHPSLRSHARSAGCWRPYAAESPFNTPVPPNAPRLVNSQAIVDRWLGFWDLNAPVFDGGTARTPYDYDRPIYFARGRHPRYRIRCVKWVSSCEVHGARVRIPPRARPATGSDRHMTVIDPASGREYDFWEARRGRRGRVLEVGHGGITSIHGHGTGTAATASHFALGAGVIRPHELAAGEIDHALFMVVKCTNGQSVAPAGPGGGRSCASIGLPNANAPRMGEHFVLDMTATEIEALPTAEWRKTILHAMREYGLYVGDTGGGMLKLQSGASWTSFGYADPWLRLGRALGAPAVRYGDRRAHRFDLRRTIDWRSRLEVVSPCAATGAC